MPTSFRLHPTINFARVGSSDNFYLSPETSAGLPVAGEEHLLGGLPIRRGTENEPISSDDLRDSGGNLLRQAARFRIYVYDFAPPESYPNRGGVEVVRGTRLADGRVVADVVWTVHLANKKANAYDVIPSQGLQAFADHKLPGLRNASLYGTVDTTQRLQQLVIDAGPRALTSSAGGIVAFDARTVASYSDGTGVIAQLPSYPVSFPDTVNSRLFQPSGPLDSLGELRTDERGRLLVLAGHGRTAAVYDEYGDPMPLTGDLNNDGWFDDAADGPVSATIVFSDGPSRKRSGPGSSAAIPRSLRRSAMSSRSGTTCTTPGSGARPAAGNLPGGAFQTDSALVRRRDLSGLPSILDAALDREPRRTSP